eukprot:NODE_1869_length_875_cov_384.548426_g1303_i0.p4 GENE.NODE_1869_length_875_cov_384.548426_g1303_i0~~NODE_1869_length_875_cov_384.548426_g1303_i0.p4  ORF type:complete len:55 (+),score=2.93 NODE_1869_length_875_cov_384.548426_g1303_i0:183-347(+)
MLLFLDITPIRHNMCMRYLYLNAYTYKYIYINTHEDIYIYISVSLYIFVNIRHI